jgi:hypothetical protein
MNKKEVGKAGGKGHKLRHFGRRDAFCIGYNCLFLYL